MGEADVGAKTSRGVVRKICHLLDDNRSPEGTMVEPILIAAETSAASVGLVAINRTIRRSAG
jgi:hypothetical protein